MSDYRVLFARAARKELESLPEKVQQRVLQAAESLAEEPRPRGCKKLKGHENTYRVRVGDYRVVYEIHEKEVIVLIVRVRHRKDAYE